MQDNEQSLVRIQKYLSNKGLLSRKKTEEYIQKGWIIVNGSIVKELGTKINPLTDNLEISSEANKENYTYLLFNKPTGITTNCPQYGEKEIIDLLPPKYKHLHSIGRLDKDSEGLILMTNDGTVANYFLNSTIKHERTYEVTIDSILTPAMIEKLEQGIKIMDRKTKKTKVIQKNKYSFLITLTEGRNRQIRRMLKKIGANVTILKRINFAGIPLGKIPAGKFLVINKADLKLRI
jgi:pseudouridine synthase